MEADSSCHSGRRISDGFFSGWLVRELETSFLLNNLHQHNQNTFALLSAVSVDAIIAEDRPLLQTIINQSIKHDPQILSLKIENEEGIILAKWQKKSLQPPSSSMSFSENIVFEGETFGKITIEWSVTTAYQKIEDHVNRARLFVCGILSLLAALIVLWVHFLTIGPIRKIHRKLIELAQRDGTSNLNLLASQELNYLAESVNTLGDLLQLRESYENELEDLVKQRTSELKVTNRELEDKNQHNKH